MQKPTLFAIKGRDLPLSGPALIGLMQEVLGRGLPFRFQARGWSMSPFVLDGDVITVAPLLKTRPGLGAVVAFVHPGTGDLLVHRILGREETGWLTQGDNLAHSPDGLVPAANILGRVTEIQRQGRRVRLGLGIERYGITLLSRLGLLVPGLRLAAFFKNWRIGKEPDDRRRTTDDG
jgi:hypothetical protein